MTKIDYNNSFHGKRYFLQKIVENSDHNIDPGSTLGFIHNSRFVSMENRGPLVLVGPTPTFGGKKAFFSFFEHSYAEQSWGQHGNPGIRGRNRKVEE
jgi:hypothetical protein